MDVSETTVKCSSIKGFLVGDEARRLGLDNPIGLDFATILEISKDASPGNRFMCVVAELSAIDKIPKILHQNTLVGDVVAQLLVVAPGDLLKTTERYSRRPSPVDPMVKSQRQTNFFRLGDRAECTADGKVARITSTSYESPISGDSYSSLGVELAVLRDGRLARWYSHSSSPQQTSLEIKRPVLSKDNQLSRLDSWLIEHEESFGCDIDRRSFTPVFGKPRR